MPPARPDPLHMSGTLASYRSELRNREGGNMSPMQTVILRAVAGFVTEFVLAGVGG